jgi:hypothetical protein
MTDAAIVTLTTKDNPRVFTLAEAEELFPIVWRITRATYEELEPHRRALQTTMPHGTHLKQIEKRYENIVRRWVQKMERLGLVVKGLWLVDFDTGDGYLCWKFPELRIGHYHSYDTGFGGRRRLSDVVEEFDPDWANG